MAKDMFQKRKERKQQRENNKDNKTNINWYPGHMAKTKRQIIEDLKLIDVIIEVLDARIPISSQNPDVKEYAKNKKKIVILNKSDLADMVQTKRWVEYFKKKGIPAIITDSNNGKGINDVIKKIREVTEQNKEKFANKGRIGRSIRVMILGIPNVGKSSFINRITKKSTTQVGNKPGITRQKQWIRLDDGIELMDTPGVLWPKFDNQKVALNLAFTGTIKDDILERTEIGYELVKYLIENYKLNLIERYKLEEKNIEEILENTESEYNEKVTEVMDEIAKKRGAIITGGRIDYEKASRMLLDEFRSGKLGNISLERAQI